jgi:hypothetical protein
MGLETILAVIIGALATMATAIVQLIRNRAPSEGRPKKNRAFGSRHHRPDDRLYRRRLRRRSAARGERPRRFRGGHGRKYTRTPAAFVANLTPHLQNLRRYHGNRHAGCARQGGAVESLAQLPPCRVNSQPEEVGPVTCTERVAQKVALRTRFLPRHRPNVRVQARVPKTETGWAEGVLGDAAGEPCTGNHDQRIAINPQTCVGVPGSLNHSVDDTLVVRVIVDYVYPEASSSELTAAAPTAHAL